MYGCMCVCVFFMFVIQRITYTAEIEAWLFSLLINIQCDSSLSSSYHLFQVSHRPSSPTRLFRPHCFFALSPRHFSLVSFFLSHALPIPFAHSGNTLSRRIRYSRFLRTFVARESLRRSGARVIGFGLTSEMDDVGGKTRVPTSPRCRFRPHPSGSRFAKSKSRSTGMDGNGGSGTPSFSRHAAVGLGRGDPRRGSRRKRRGGSVSQSRCRRFR